MNGFRVQEGEALDNDLRERVGSISDKLSRVKQYEEDRIHQIRERIGNNLAAYLKKEEVDENRFEQELIFYIEKLDISEEKVRLANHCKYFLEYTGRFRSFRKKVGFYIAGNGSGDKYPGIQSKPCRDTAPGGGNEG